MPRTVDDVSAWVGVARKVSWKVAVSGGGMLALLASTTVVAQTNSPIPLAVGSHMTSLDARCKGAGGRPGDGRYVIAHDYTGDGLTDYLLSEGDYNCIGRPGLFRQDGQARIDIFVTDRANSARRVYSDILIGYRVLAGKPAKVQIARKGAACGSAPTVQCAAQLEWTGQSFGEGTSVSNARARTPTMPPPPTTPASGAAAVSEAVPVLIPVAVNAEADFLVQCRKNYVSRDARNSRWAADQCKEDWRKVVASGPAAQALLAIIHSISQGRPSVATIKQRATGVRWSARTAPPSIATGTLGAFSVSVEGKTLPSAVQVSWTKVGELIPYDVVNAMKVRGATLTEVSCEKTGVGEGSRVYAGSIPDGAPFTLTVDLRTAPVAMATSYYNVSVGLDGRQPTRGSTNDCEF